MPKFNGKVIHIGNILNNGYLTCKFLRREGIAADSYNINYGHTQGQPEWEEVKITEPVPEWDPDWTKVKINNFVRPKWFHDIKICVANITNRDLDKLFPYHNYLIRKYKEFFPDMPNISHSDLRQIIPYGIKYAEIARKGTICQAYATNSAYILGANTDIPYICFEHGTLREHPFQDTPLGKTYRLSLALAEKIIITNADCNIAAEKLGLKNYVFIPHPFDESKYVPNTNSQLRHKLIDEHKCNWIFLAPARHHWKNCPDGMKNTWLKRNDILIKALGKLFHEKPYLKALVIFFEWGQEVELSKSLIKECGFADKVRWEPLKSKPALKDFYDAADIVFDQFNDGIGTFGTVVPEALACGKPVILNYNEALHHWCYPEPPPVLNAKDESGIIAHIDNIISNRDYRENIGVEGISWIRKYHSSKVVASKNIEIYEEIEDKRKKGKLSIQQIKKTALGKKQEFCALSGAHYNEEYRKVACEYGLDCPENWSQIGDLRFITTSFFVETIDFFLKCSSAIFIPILFVAYIFCREYRPILFYPAIALLILFPIFRFIILLTAIFRKLTVVDSITVILDNLYTYSPLELARAVFVSLFIPIRLIDNYRILHRTNIFSVLQFSIANILYRIFYFIDAHFFKLATFILPILPKPSRNKYANSSQTKVVHVTCSFDYGGTQKQLISLCSAPSSTYSHIPIEVFPQHNKMFRVAEPIDATRYTRGSLLSHAMGLLTIKKESSSLKIIQTYKIYKDFKALKPDLVIGWGHEICIYTYIAAVIARIPHIIFCIRTVNPFYYGNENETVFKKIHLAAFPNLSSVIVNSSFLKKDYSAWLGVNDEKIHVCSNGVDINEIAKLKNNMNKTSSRASLGIPDNAKVILNVGRFSPEKGQMTMVKVAMSLQVQDKYKNIHWIFCGDGPILDEIKKIVNNKGIINCHFVGSTASPSIYYSAADIFIMPSDFEGQPNAMMEAMCWGLPCISTDQSGALDLADDGVEALFIPPGSPVALAEKIEFLLENPHKCKEMGENAKRRIKEFSVEGMVSKFNRIILNS